MCFTVLIEPSEKEIANKEKNNKNVELPVAGSLYDCQRFNFSINHNLLKCFPGHSHIFEIVDQSSQFLQCDRHNHLKQTKNQILLLHLSHKVYQ